MKSPKVIAAALLCLMVWSVSAEADVSFKLQRTAGIFTEDPPGAPLPLGRRQNEAGNILYNGQKIGEYLRVYEVHANTLNVAQVTLTLMFSPGGSALPESIVLQGAHNYDNGDESGSISASSIPGVAGYRFTYRGGVNVLTLLIP